MTCDIQDKIDCFWAKLNEGGDPSAQQCGWLKDKFGLFWQIVPKALQEMFASGTSAQTGRAMKAMLPMKKLDIAGLEKAYDGAG